MQILINSLSDDDKSIQKYDNFYLNNIKDINIERKLTYHELKANLKMFMLAGYESTSYALTNCLFTLAIKKEEQQKLFDEIEEHFCDESILQNLESIETLSYLDMFCKEVLRYYPISRV